MTEVEALIDSAPRRTGSPSACVRQSSGPSLDAHPGLCRRLRVYLLKRFRNGVVQVLVWNPKQ
jgi:hypothetical protein